MAPSPPLLDSARPNESASRHTQDDLRTLRELSRWLDDAFRLPNTNLRFGLDPILGLIPGVGDSVSTAAAIYILLAATRMGVPRVTIMRMAMNVGIDYLFGSIPVIGDLFDVWWKANRRNMQLLEQRSGVYGVPSRSAKWHDWAFVAGIIMTLLLLLAGSIAVAMWLIQITWHMVTA